MDPSVSDKGAVYEIKLVAYNGNGESDCSKRLVSLAGEGTNEQATGEYEHSLFSLYSEYSCKEAE